MRHSERALAGTGGTQWDRSTLNDEAPPAGVYAGRRGFLLIVSEGVGFEPTRTGIPPQRFSRQPPSASLLGIYLRKRRSALIQQHDRSTHVPNASPGPTLTSRLTMCGACSYQTVRLASRASLVGRRGIDGGER